MTKHAGGGLGVSSGDGTMHARKGWQQTPRWHWRYWIGQRMRHETYRVAPGAAFAGLSWTYRTFGQHARMVLEEQANGRAGENITATEVSRRFNSGGYGSSI